MARGARLLMCAAGCAAIVATVLTPSVASGERGRSSDAQVVPQRIVLPAAAPATPVLPVERAVKAATMRREPIRAEMAGTEVTTRDCAGASGAETKLGMLENSAVWGHCYTP